MMAAINQAGHVTGTKTIAEFVENDSILEHVQKIGVDYAQGYMGGAAAFNINPVVFSKKARLCGSWPHRCRSLSDAIDKISALATQFACHQPMHVGFEAGEFLVEIAGEFQVIDNRLVEALPRNQ
jgi:EAL domain-containing protein (putative c-di-GMP-specific phosphodiesterase class I)